MDNSNLLQRIINAYCRKNNNWEINYSQLLDFINNLVINDESGRYNVFSTNTSDILTAMLIDLNESGACSLSYIGTAIDSIQNYGYLNHAVQAAFEKMESNSEYPFPTQHSLGITIPDEQLTSIHLPENLSVALNTGKSERGKIYKLILSGDLNALIAEGSIIQSRMLVLAVNKIRNFLTYKNNSNFMYQKLLPGCGKNTSALVDTIKMVQSNPGRAAEAIKKPDEFIFSFWTQLCSFVRKDLSGKEHKTSHDEGLLQAAFLINAFILHYKNIIITGKRKKEALKFVGDKLTKEPFHFTISDIYSFKDKSGLLLDKKYKRDDLHNFINKKLKVVDNNVLPELIKVKTINNKLYYIHRSVFLNLAYSKIGKAHDHYRRYYLDSWAAEFRNFKAPQVMNSDENFHADLEKKIKKEDPILYAILGYELLYLAITDSNNIKLKAVAQGWIDTRIQATRPLPIVLDLRRKDLAAEVRSIVPFWLTLGFFRKIAAIFSRNKKQKNKKKSSPISSTTRSTISESQAAAVPSSKAAKSGTSKALEYKTALNNLKKQFGYSNSSSLLRLEELANQWNPLFDYEARNNLVKDVNNMIRDYMRKILRETAFAVPNKERVVNIAELLAGNKAFTVIKKRESFMSYITLYIIKTLNDTKP